MKGCERLRRPVSRAIPKKRAPYGQGSLLYLMSQVCCHGFHGCHGTNIGLWAKHSVHLSLGTKEKVGEEERRTKPSDLLMIASNYITAGGRCAGAKWKGASASIRRASRVAAAEAPMPMPCSVFSGRWQTAPSALLICDAHHGAHNARASCSQPGRSLNRVSGDWVLMS